MQQIRCQLQAQATNVPSTPLILKGPPPAYDHRKQLLARSLTIVKERWPQLLPLATEGTLVAVPRPEDYLERRTDGYREPHMVLLVGTAHVSPQSAQDVARVIKATAPEAVVVELCKSRSAQLYIDDDDSQNTGKLSSLAAKNPLSMSGGNNLLDTFQRSMALGGKSALLLRLLLGNVSTQLAGGVGVEAPGVEFRAARRAADTIGASVVLGDRPIEITLKRAWEALPWKSRWNLALDLFSGIRNAQRVQQKEALDALERLRKDDDLLSMLLASLAERYPETLSPLLHERDLYLAWSLKRSKAVNGTNVVVGVIGKGHMKGVCYALTEFDSSSLRFRDLAGGSSSRKNKDGIARFVGRLAVETAVFGCLWHFWTTLSF